tara:strand:- start:10321 stop:10449 length:129 start_codon:yes stop_codon:yes gene_type:complete
MTANAVVLKIDIILCNLPKIIDRAYLGRKAKRYQRYLSGIAF